MWESVICLVALQSSLEGKKRRQMEKLGLKPNEAISYNPNPEKYGTAYISAA